MNIYALDYDPKKAAEYHNNTHCNLMIRDVAKILCTVRFLLTDGRNIPYKPVNLRHGCVQWAATSPQNYHWLASLGTALIDERMYRFQRDDKRDWIIKECAGLKLDGFGKKGLTPFYMATGKNRLAKDFKSAIMEYRLYYRESQRHLAKWSKRGSPSWWS